MSLHKPGQTLSEFSSRLPQKASLLCNFKKPTSGCKRLKSIKSSETLWWLILEQYWSFSTATEVRKGSEAQHRLCWKVNPHKGSAAHSTLRGSLRKRAKEAYTEQEARGRRWFTALHPNLLLASLLLLICLKLTAVTLTIPVLPKDTALRGWPPLKVCKGNTQLSPLLLVTRRKAG